ncbi:hypothetical protein HELRODRAFT_71602 [Helobdella robusta]|uniref:SH3 domain-containing protein n=1 Tax=Helobdella robusta TaxID=6412 RepID=T1G0N9_HELRO|nr:hypothetical protein HELRODRAFT_71602 [Helobdella robusta]ESO11564.1 hypothetical protein HELRODRAFT_71602 [Helobdella robusta]
MSLAGFKKQINKANQYVSEKIGGAKGTELDEEFMEMEKRTDAMVRLVDDLMVKTHEMLQPNPASRARMLAVKSISKLRGTSNHTLYPQPEGQLGESMVKYGKELGEDSFFGQALFEAGETYKQIAEMKYLKEDTVKQNFTEPLLHLQNKDLKEVNHHRKKLHGRRLDFDCKKRRGILSKVLHLKRCEVYKVTFSLKIIEKIHNNIGYGTVFRVLVHIPLKLHSQTFNQLTLQKLEIKSKQCAEASSRPKKEYVPKKILSTNKLNVNDGGSGFKSNSRPNSRSASPVNSALKISGPSCEALYDFDAENDGELGFKEGDVIQLLSRIDENWFEGQINGQIGYFPTNYVKVLVELP